jgi:poly-gamma-glutamate capsule biosynthesis protein CapA/YwtB (metallophosphatase superfamily)
VIVASMHWGGNWGYRTRDEETRFAHQLIEHGIAVVHGHSSHHVKTAEIHSDRLVLYGCGDFLNDYEGISGYEVFRSDLRLMYLPAMDPRRGRCRRAHGLAGSLRTSCGHIPPEALYHEFDELFQFDLA